jgi:hypothetical protein
MKGQCDPVIQITPNCVICKWKSVEEQYKNAVIFTSEPSEKARFVKVHICMAQGYGKCDDCYGTPECESLFKKKNRILSDEDINNLVTVTSSTIQNNPIAIRHIIECIDWIGKVHSNGCNLQSVIKRSEGK